ARARDPVEGDLEVGELQRWEERLGVHEPLAELERWYVDVPIEHTGTDGEVGPEQSRASGCDALGEPFDVRSAVVHGGPGDDVGFVVEVVELGGVHGDAAG